VAHSVEISDDLMVLVRREAELQGRSVAEQIAHWIKIGSAIENSPNFDYARVSAALEGKLETAELTQAEDAVWLEAFAERMGNSTEEEDAFYARLGGGACRPTD
jgi:hypothetical protein